MQTAIVTGCSTGIGHATALHLAREGYRVYATVRSVASGAALTEAAGDLPLSLLVLDVDSDESVASGIATVIEAEGGIDVLVNNAGIGDGGDIETISVERFEAVMNTNTWGVLRCIQAVLPTMREQRRGCIVTVTSAAGRMVAAGMSPYTASKWAAEALCETLALEVAPFGIRVAIIEPGVVATPIFAKGGERPPDLSSPYLNTNMRVPRWMMARLATPSAPEDAAHVIHEAITTTAPRLRYLVGPDAEAFVSAREGMTDEAWVEAMSLVDDEQWRANMLKWTNTEVPPM